MAKGSVDRKIGEILTLETGSGVGKTYAAEKIDVLLERAARAKAASVPDSDTVRELNEAFDEDRVAVLNLDFNGGGDFLIREEVRPSFNPSLVLGIRLAARGLFNVSTEELRNQLIELPEEKRKEVQRLFTVEKVWPLMCQRQRAAHGLAADSHADPRPLIIICTCDEFQLVTRDLREFGYSEPEAIKLCKDFQRCLVYLVMKDGDKITPAAKHGVYFVPTLVGTSLYALNNCESTLLRWDRAYLQPLNFADSRQVFRRALQSQKVDASVIDRFENNPYVLATLEMAGGVPALIQKAAKTFAKDDELVRCRKEMMLDGSFTPQRLFCFSSTWLQRWMEALESGYPIKAILLRLCGGVEHKQHFSQVARRLLLLLLTGMPIDEEQPLCEASRARLGDALKIGAFYPRKEGERVVISMPAILLLMLKSTPDALKACSAAERKAIAMLTPNTIMLHRDTEGGTFERMVLSQIILVAACRMEMGLDVKVRYAELFRGCTGGIPGGCMTENMRGWEVDVRGMQIARDTHPSFLKTSPCELRDQDHGDLVALGAEGEKGPFSVLREAAHFADPTYAVHMDTYRPGTGRVHGCPLVDLRVSHARSPPSEPIVALISVKMRSDNAYEPRKDLVKYQKAWHELEAEARRRGVQLVLGLITSGIVLDDGFKDIEAGRLVSKRPEKLPGETAADTKRRVEQWKKATPEEDKTDACIFVLSGEACSAFMPVLQHRPHLRDAVASECAFSAAEFGKLRI